MEPRATMTMAASPNGFNVPPFQRRFRAPAPFPPRRRYRAYPPFPRALRSATRPIGMIDGGKRGSTGPLPLVGSAQSAPACARLLGLFVPPPGFHLLGVLAPAASPLGVARVLLIRPG